MQSGHAFRFEIPDHLKGRVSNDVLEHLAEIVAMWLGALEGEASALECCFSCVDNASAIRWTCKSKFTGCHNHVETNNDDVHWDETLPHLILSRKLVSLVIESKARLHVQCIKGVMNVVADSLSWDFHLSDVVLTNLLLHFYLKQLLSSFRMLPLPEEKSFFVIRTLDALPTRSLAQMLDNPSTLGAGLVRLDLFHLLDSVQTRSWIESH